MQVPLIDLDRQHSIIREELNKAIGEIIDGGKFILGETVEKFEKDIANYLGVPYALGVGSGTDALLLALKAYDIKPGDEVITTPFTFISPVEVILSVGAIPVFIDIDPETFNIDAEKIEEKITKKTKAIIPVHLFGHPSNMEKIVEIGKKHNIPIIEDVAQAMGTEYNGKKLGSLGNIGCFSFYPTKNLSCLGDGGLITTKNEEIYKKIKALRSHGAVKEKYVHEYVGVNSRLDALQAAVLKIKLKYLEKWNNQRKKLAEKYTTALKEIVKTPKQTEGSTYNSYSIQTESRDSLKEFLKEKGISTSIFYPQGLHLQECLKHLEHKTGDFPITESCSKKVLSLPIFPGMTDEEIDYVIEAIKEFLSSN